MSVPEWSQSPAERPLRHWSAEELRARFGQALTAAEGVAGAHCVHEWWMRGLPGPAIDRALEQLWRHASASIPGWLPMSYIEWLPAAYDVALRFRPRRRGRYNLYLVLLDYRDRRDGPHGVYVGMSHYTPEQRFDQHKAGIRAAGCVLKRGLEVLLGPTLHLQRIERGVALELESQLAEALAEAGIRVKGGH